MTILFRLQGAFGWFSYTTSGDAICPLMICPRKIGHHRLKQWHREGVFPGQLRLSQIMASYNTNRNLMRVDTGEYNGNVCIYLW